MTKKRRLEEYLRDNHVDAISEARWHDLIALLAPVSTSYLRDLLHAAGLPVVQPFGGVRLDSFPAFEASLLEMADEYAKGARSRDCRHAVIQAKDRARLISRNEKVDPAKRRQKAEMVEWMLVWLENPGIFAAWAALRKNTPDYLSLVI